MTSSVSLLPPLSGWTLPVPSIVGLTDDEQALMRGLSAKLMLQTPLVQQSWAYYDGLQRLNNLGISVPQQLVGVRTVVDWPRICCDPLVDRAAFAGFRFPAATDVDDELAALWDANSMDSELPMAILDSLVAGRGYLIVGSPDAAGDAPLVTVESPLNMSVTWDPRTKQVTAGYQAYEVEGLYRAVLYLPDQTISMSRDSTSDVNEWVVDDRDQHNFGEVPVVRLVNRSRTSDREGRSQITPAVMNTTDSAVRSLLGMEIAREVYSVPRLYILGASESDFVDSQGNPKSAMSAVMTKMLALDRDEEGELPKVGQFTSFDPAVFTKIIDKHAQLMASYTGFPPSYFGETTTANPASADAIRVADNGIDRAGTRVQRQSSAPLRKVAQLMWRFANGGAPLPAEVERVQPEWVSAATPTPAATSDAITKQIAAGAVPAWSDVVLEELGYTPIQRARLALDRANDPEQQLLAEIGTSVDTKDVLAAIRLLKSSGLPSPDDPAGAIVATPPAATAPASPPTVP